MDFLAVERRRSLHYRQEDFRTLFDREIVPSNDSDFPTQCTWSFSSLKKRRKEDSRELILLPYWSGIMEYIVNTLVLI